jgi:hypothetical protein
MQPEVSQELYKHGHVDHGVGLSRNFSMLLQDIIETRNFHYKQIFGDI